MLDQEIQSLLEDAGYRFNPASGSYVSSIPAGEDDAEHGSEYVADELGIPLDDLQRWEIEQQNQAEQGPG